MDVAQTDSIRNWLIQRGLAGDSEVDLLHGFCTRCLAAELELARAMIIIDTLHPVYEGRAFFWSNDKALTNNVSEYGPNVTPGAAQDWNQSPFYALFHSSTDELRMRLHAGETGGFAVLEELRLEEQTDYLAMIQRFEREAIIGEMDCVLSRWTTRKPNGFSDADLDALRGLVPALALAIKSASLTRVAQSLVETYLGRDAGRRVLEGRMSRGVVEKIHAVLWFSDMKGYTSLSENMSSDALVPLLDDYADAVISSVHAAGGDVLKLMGDGILAIFHAGDDAPSACRAALAAEADLRARLMALQEHRAAHEEPVASIYLGLHVGDVFYGNIGSKERLDFTVVGQAVNEVSRIAAMCSSADRPVLFSRAFRQTLPEAEREPLVSVGRYALRGLARAQELFTILPE